MTKEQYNFRIEPEVHRKLKIIAADSGKHIGDVIGDMVYFIEQRAEQRRQLLREAGLDMGQPVLSLALMADDTIQSMLDNAEVLKQDKDGWSAEDGFSMKDKAAEIKRKDQDNNNK